uniref:Uncharacterized protein n=1 Tax=uncultured crenarchaeote MCG TaxID=529375 RepID=B2YI63_9CREN|nr:hypothetical protein [uncultured crenarchaeote MCG]
MTIAYIVKTGDKPQVVGKTVCDYNFYQGEHPEDKYSWIIELGRNVKEEGDYWEIKGKYEPLKDLTLIALVYQAGETVVLSEIDDDLSINFLEPLLRKYGFDCLKWIIVPSKR